MMEYYSTHASVALAANVLTIIEHSVLSPSAWARLRPTLTPGRVGRPPLVRADGPSQLRSRLETSNTSTPRHGQNQADS